MGSIEEELEDEGEVDALTEAGTVALRRWADQGVLTVVKDLDQPMIRLLAHRGTGANEPDPPPRAGAKGAGERRTPKQGKRTRPPNG